MFNLKNTLKTSSGGDKLMRKIIEGVCLSILVVNLLVGTLWAMGKKPTVSEQLGVSSEKLAEVQPEVKTEGKESSEVTKAESEVAKVKVAEQERTQTAEAQAIELKPVMEYKLPQGEEIVDVIFDEAEMTVSKARALGMKGLEQRKATEIVKVQYPKVVVTKKAVKFLDERGKVISKISLKESQIIKTAIFEPGPPRERLMSPLVSLVANRIFLAEWCVDGFESYHLDLSCFDTKGNLIWQKKNQPISSMSLSGNGRYIVYGGEMSDINVISPVGVYDIKDGKKLWEKKLNSDARELHILNDGQIVLVELFSGDEWITKISLIDLNGNEVWNYKIKHLISPSSWCPQLLSAGDKIIIYIELDPYDDNKPIYYGLYGFDKKGNLLWKPKEYKEEEDEFELAISKNGNYLAGFDRHGYVQIMNISRGEFIAKSHERIDISGALDISMDGNYVMLDTSTKWPGTILFDGKTGRILKHIGYFKGRFLGSDKIWRKRENKIEIFNISDILKEGN